MSNYWGINAIKNIRCPNYAIAPVDRILTGGSWNTISFSILKVTEIFQRIFRYIIAKCQ